MSTRKRLKWFDVIVAYGLYNDFLIWKDQKRRKIKSYNRLAFNFLLKTYGRDWIKFQRANFVSAEELKRIVKTPWIKMPGE